MAKFIGIENVKAVAERIEPNITMGPAYFSKEELARLGIKVVTGIQYKDTALVLNRKGGTSRRKEVGTPVNSKLGYLTERTMVAHLIWNHYTHNEDEFQEKPIQIQGSAAFHYPLTEEVITEIGKEFSDDLYANLFHGDENSENESMNYFDGFQTIINKDIEAGNITVAAGNLIPCDALDAPQSEGDSSSWDKFVAWHDKWSPALKRQNVLVLCSVEYGHYIADGFGQKHRNHREAEYDAFGNFKCSDLPKVTFVPSDDWGEGTRMVATIPQNFEFGVNNEADESFVSVKQGSDQDHKDISFQIQTIAGCRIKRIIPSCFVTNGGAIEDKYWSGDYQKDAVYATPNDATLGTVAMKKADNTPVASGTEVVKGTTLTVTATPKDGAEFVKWSNGSTANPTSIVTTGDPMAITALFRSTSSSSD